MFLLSCPLWLVSSVAVNPQRKKVTEMKNYNVSGKLLPGYGRARAHAGVCVCVRVGVCVCVFIGSSSGSWVFSRFHRL